MNLINIGNPKNEKMKKKEHEIITPLLKGFFSKTIEFSDLEQDSLKYICEGYYREFIEKLKTLIEPKVSDSIEVQKKFIQYFFKNNQRYDFFKPDLDLSKAKMKSKTNTSFLREENEKTAKEIIASKIYFEISEGNSKYKIDDVVIEIHCPKVKGSRIRIYDPKLAKEKIEELAFIYQFNYTNMTTNDNKGEKTSYLESEKKRYKIMKENINPRKKIIADSYIQYFGVKAKNKTELYYNVLIELGWAVTKEEFELKLNKTKNPNSDFDFRSHKTNTIDRLLKNPDIKNKQIT